MPDKSKTDSCSANGNGKNEPETYASTGDYFLALEKWLHDVYMWQSLTAAFPYALMTNQFVPAGAGNVHHFGTGQSGASVFPYVTFVQNNDVLRNRRPASTAVRQTQDRQHAAAEEGVEYRIPPLWKRFVAEFLDFLILLFWKFAVTLVAVDVFDFIDVDKYDLDVLRQHAKIDYYMALEMTSEILLLEMIHRIVVCLFEAFWLQRGTDGHAGGATPGKLVMGIRVVVCTKVTHTEGRPVDVVTVYPGTDLGFGWAFARAFAKSMILALLFPVCFVLFFFRHNRTGYDIMCRTIVVEDPQRQQHQ